jgi:hypothetical protein
VFGLFVGEGGRAGGEKSLPLDFKNFPASCVIRAYANNSAFAFQLFEMFLNSRRINLKRFGQLFSSDSRIRPYQIKYLDEVV